MKSKYFHFSTKLCAKCNSERSQKFDEAWEKLSKYIHLNWKDISLSGKINLEDVFGSTYKEDMLLVQLYFGKIFATKLLSSGVELDLTLFSTAILDGKEINHFYISFRYSNKPSNYSASSDVQVCKDNKNEDVYIQHFCIIGELGIDMIYSENTEGLNLYGALKPSQFTDTIKLSQLNYEQNYIPKKINED